MNIWSFTGNLGRDAEIKHLPNGTAVCEFPVAVTSGYGDKKQTTWARCVIFGKKAEGGLPSYLVKGQKVAISGEACLREWDKPDGGKGFSLQVVVGNLDLIGDKAPGQQPQQQPQQQAPAASGMFDDDIPF